jgi:hypothetical protein
MSWTNDYIGIPYLGMGRDRAGADCWGLVRLVYRDRYGIDLPDYSEQAYNAADGAETAPLIAAGRDVWSAVTEPAEGDVVLLRIKGYPSHVGVLVGPAQMLHVYRDGLTACIERLDSGVWKHRIEGYYRHADRLGGVVLSGCPHPLKTVNLMGTAQPGATLREMIEAEAERAKVPRELIVAGHAWVDGKYIEPKNWHTVRPAAGQRVEYRVLPRGGNSDTRTILAIVVMIVVSYYAPGAGDAAVGAMGLEAGSLGAYAVGAAVYMGMAYAGMKLVDAIAPVRMPSQDNSQIKSKYMLQGGPNNVAPYAALPVVLGQFRWTPPVAALPYAETTASENFLRTVLCWGYGPLDVSDLRIGDTPLSKFEDIQIAHLRGVEGESKTEFNKLYGQDVSQESVGVKLETAVAVDRVTAADIDGIKLVFSFTQGLWQTATSGVNAGANVDGVQVRVRIEYRPTGVGSFVEVSQAIGADTLALPPVYDEQSVGAVWGESDIGDWWYAEYGWYRSIIGDESRLPLYQWTLLVLDRYNNIVMRHGCITDNKDADASFQLRYIMQSNNYGLEITDWSRTPLAMPGELELFRICVQGETVVETVDLRDASITGCALTLTGLAASIAAGSIIREHSEGLVISGATKSAFDRVVMWKVPTGQYDVRVTLTTDDAPTGVYPSGNGAAIYRDCYFNNITGISNTRPIVPKKPMAMTALRIRATNQLNGSMEGITGTVKSVCLDYVKATATWIARHTRNPASLFRYVLQHPANAVAVADAGINLTALERWHNYCRANKFTFDMVITGQRPLLDVLKDIAAAGRASPQLVDGKWSVVIDEPRTVVVQHFTPHNSWGFEGTRILPKRPHALRVQFFNREKGYQNDERIVYDDGYTAANATLIEGIELPGITAADNVHAFGRFHLAQLALRPDTYALNADMEHLICTRGDKVRVTHDVPMWGLGSGRIREVLTSGVDATGIVVDESFPMDASAAYCVRIRRSTGASLVCDIVPAEADGYYTTLMFTAPVAASLIAANDLVLYGVAGSESVELIVTGIQPDNKGGARLTMVDYATGVFNADEEAIPPYDSQITQPPLLMRPVIASGKVPSVKRVVSDESALSVGGDGGLVSNILVSFSYAANLPKSVTHVLLQYGVAAPDMVWDALPSVPLSAGIVVIPDVRDGVSYSFRMCYLDEQGIQGRWGVITTETVVGKTSKPQTPTGLKLTPDLNDYVFDFDDNPEIDVAGYEVRDADEGWGGPGRLWRGKVSQCHVPYGPVGVATTYYVKAFDRGGRYSDVAASLTNTLTAPAAPAVTGAFEADSYRLNWSVPAAAVPVDLYEIRYGDTWAGATSLGTIRATSISIKASWIGARRFWVAAIDLAKNAGDGGCIDATITVAPAPVITAQVIDNNAILRWTAVRGTLPTKIYEVRRGDVFETATVLGTKDGTFDIAPETVAGTYTYWVVQIDRADNYGAPGSTIATVDQVPDYILRSNIDSDFSGTKSNMVAHGDGSLIAPVNDTETVAQHFGRSMLHAPDDFADAAWTKTRATIATDALAVEGGAKFADKLQVDATAASSHLALQNSAYGVSPGTAVIATVRCKAGEHDEVYLYFSGGAGYAFSAALGANLNLLTGVVSLVSAGVTTILTDLGGGEYEFSISAVTTQTTAKPVRAVVYIADSTGTGTGRIVIATPTAGNGIYIWEHQLALGSAVLPRWYTPQNQIDAGFPVVIQPNLSPAYYEEVVDYGTVLAGTRITVNLNALDLVGSVARSCKISVSTDGVIYTDYDDVWQVYASNFQFVKYLLTFTASNSTDLIEVEAINYRLDLKHKTRSIPVTFAAGDAAGTEIYLTDDGTATGNKLFMDAKVTFQPYGTARLSWVVDFTDVPDPLSCKVLVWDSAGTRVSGTGCLTVGGS